MLDFTTVICIYCKQSTVGDNTQAHVFPEALGNRNLLLRPGTVCKRCNQYAGHELENELVAHPSIAMALHYLGIQGKQKRLRKQLGTVVRQESEPGTVSMQFGIAESRLTFHADGTVEMRAHATTPSGFRHDRFRRALHYVAMNVAGRIEGATSVLDVRYDPVRDYIRRPRNRREAWIYAEDNPAVNNIPLVLNGALIEAPNGKIVALQLFQTVYAVDLLNSGDLRAAASQREAKVVEADVKNLPPVVIQMRVKQEAPPAV